MMSPSFRKRLSGVDVFYVHTDHLNTPRKVSRPSDNKVRWRWNPPPFGNSTPNQNPEALRTFVYNLRYPASTFRARPGSPKLRDIGERISRVHWVAGTGPALQTSRRPPPG
jgi:hypothetical protein